MILFLEQFVLKATAVVTTPFTGDIDIGIYICAALIAAFVIFIIVRQIRRKK